MSGCQLCRSAPQLPINRNEACAPVALQLINLFRASACCSASLLWHHSMLCRANLPYAQEPPSLAQLPGMHSQ